jgi:hypothetical protein
MNNKIILALSQIFLLIISIIAIGYALGSEVRVVSAQSTEGVCFWTDGIPGEGLGEYGAFKQVLTSPAKKNEGGTQKTISLPGENVKYYINSNKDVWKPIYDAYYLSEQNGNWYYWFIYDNEFDSRNYWHEAPVTPTIQNMQICVKFWAGTLKDSNELTPDDIQGDTTTRSEEGIISNEDNTKCNQLCFNGGYNSGSCSSTSCKEEEYALGKSGCNFNGECCCFDLPTTNNEKDEIPNLNLPSGANLGSIFKPKSNLKCSEQWEGGICKNTCDTNNEIQEGQKGAYSCSSTQVCCHAKDAEKKEVSSPSKTQTTNATKGAPFGFGKEWWAYLAGHVIEGAAWAGGILAANELLKGFLPEEYQGLVNEYAWTAAGAVLAGKTVTGALEAAFPGMRAVEGGSKISSAGWIGMGAAALYFVAAFRYETYEVVTFTCQPWDSPTGGDYCEECNQGILPCSEYQCRSLGQACELVNQGTDEERCTWINRGDVEFPRIEAWEEALINEDYEYEFQNTGISPPDTGVKIIYTEAQPSQCVPAFTPLSFGIKLTNEDEEPEAAKCKLDTTRKENFDDMRFYFSDGLLLEEHSYSLSLPGAEGDVEIENDGEYSIYVRCQDANGNYNTANFVFNFCVDQGPDTTPPLIVQTSIPSGMPIAFNQTSIDLEVYINEPVADCKWSHLDQGYENMEGEMNCIGGDNLNDVNTQGLYTCETTLDGIKDRQENDFYFRCEDTTGNINSESHKFTLIGTQPLVIDWVKPENGSIIKDSTEAVKVTLEARTSVGYKEGESNCYFSDTGEENNYPLFLGDGDYSNYEHSQDLWLPEGSYEYTIKCCDLGNNCDYEAINFEVESDGEDPIVVRAYHEETYLKLITNEAARCVYDTKYENYPCDYTFEDGTSMTTLEDVNHYTDWNPQETLYIICQDEYGNQPWPDGCSFIVRPSDLY